MLSVDKEADFCPEKTTKLPVILLIYNKKSSFAETCHSKHIPFPFELIGWTAHSWLEVGFV